MLDCCHRTECASDNVDRYRKGVLAVCSTPRKLHEFNLWTWQVCGVGMFLQLYLRKIPSVPSHHPPITSSHTRAAVLKFWTYLERIWMVRDVSGSQAGGASLLLVALPIQRALTSHLCSRQSGLL